MTSGKISLLLYIAIASFFLGQLAADFGDVCPEYTIDVGHLITGFLMLFGLPLIGAGINANWYD